MVTKGISIIKTDKSKQRCFLCVLHEGDEDVCEAAEIVAGNIPTHTEAANFTKIIKYG